MRRSIILKVIAIASPGALLILGATLAPLPARAPLLTLSILSTIALATTVFLRNIDRLAHRTAATHEMITANRVKASNKEFQILEKAHHQEELLSQLVSELRQLSNTTEELHKLTGNIAENLHKKDHYTLDNKPAIENDLSETQKNRLALQQVLTRLIKTQEDIAERLFAAKLEDFASRNPEDGDHNGYQ